MLTNRNRRPPGLDSATRWQFGNVARLGFGEERAPVLTGEHKKGPRRTPDVALRAVLRNLRRLEATQAVESDAPVLPLTPKIPETVLEAGPEAVAEAGQKTEPEASDETEEHGLSFGSSPVDLPPDPANDDGGLRWMLTVIAVSSALLLVFNSFAIDKWARQLETTATTGPIKDAAARWHGAMQALYLDVPLESGRWLWREAKAARFSDDQQENDPRR